MEVSSRKYLLELESMATLAAPRVARNSSEPQAIRNLEVRETEQRELVRAMADDEQLLLKGRLTTWDHFLFEKYSYPHHHIGRRCHIPGFQLQIFDPGNL
jgi:hypothetical protein